MAAAKTEDALPPGETLTLRASEKETWVRSENGAIEFRLASVKPSRPSKMQYGGRARGRPSIASMQVGVRDVGLDGAPIECEERFLRGGGHMLRFSARPGHSKATYNDYDIYYTGDWQKLETVELLIAQNAPAVKSALKT